MPSKSPKRRAPRRKSTCVFQRLLICHYRLPEICLDGGLDEGASVEELSEHILYYHCDASAITKNASSTIITAEAHGNHASSDAIQFAGLCSAVLSLPNVLAGDESDADETREVHLNQSTLVFVPLERIDGLVAIAQVKRSNPLSSNDDNNPSSLAVRSSIRTCHDLFSLLRGGIHYTLSSICCSVIEASREAATEDISIIINDAESLDTERVTYPGMNQMYFLRKQVRRIKRDLARSNDDTEQAAMDAMIESLNGRIQCLMGVLPVTTLRKQLRTHYDEFISNATLTSAEIGKLPCCLIDNVPAPIDPACPLPMRRQFPAMPSSTAIDVLRNSAKSLLDTSKRESGSSGPILFGISMFFDGDFIFNVTSPDSMPFVSPRTSCLLMEFMTSYRRKIALQKGQHAGLQSRKTRSPPRRIGNGLRRLLSASLTDEDTVDVVDDSVNSSQHDTSHFLSPPSLSMLSVSDQILQVDLPSRGSVWTPKVYLRPLGTPSLEPSACAETIEANLALLWVGQCSFLLYLQLGAGSFNEEQAVINNAPLSLAPANDGAQVSETSEHGTIIASSSIITIPAYSRLLDMSSIDLSAAVANAADVEGDDCRDEVESPFSESGQYVVFIDRLTQRVVLYSAEVGERNNQRKLGNGSKEKSVDTSSEMDRRHFLASNLPASAVAAFDDLMAQANESSGKDVLQACTYLPHGWVYAHAEDGKELYIYFSASKFVTVSDVQHAADRIRVELFNDAYRI